jgi:release factor glutamine methyltransferase
VTVASAQLGAAERLAAAGCETPQVDAALLLAHVLRTTRSGLVGHRGRELTEAELAAFESLVARRESREPLAYVLGEWGFRRLTLSVDSRVLVPRPETEVVVERCLARLRGLETRRVLDVGTGSGAIALAIADEHPGAHVTGIDVSDDALEVARSNAQRVGLDVTFASHDLFRGLPEGPWDLVVSNPPYVRPDEVETLQHEVREWEPRVALLAEGATEALAEGARAVLRPGGVLVLEVADGDAERVAGLLRVLGYEDVTRTQDLSGRDRVVDAVTTSST